MKGVKMKKKLGILTLLLCLALSVTAFACSGGEGGGGEPADPEHVHAYTAVAEVPSTCLVQGTGAHYKCDDCGKIFVKDGEDYTETTTAALKLPLGEHNYGVVAATPSTCITHGTKAHYKCSVCNKIFTKEGTTYTETTLAALEKELAEHSFNGIVITANPTKMEYSLDGEFDPAGMVVQKTCSVEGCDGEEADESEIEWVYANEEDAFKAGMTSITIKVGEFTAPLTISVDSRVAIPTIHSKVYTGDTLTADVHHSDYYTVTKNEGGINVGSYEVQVTLVSADYTWDSEEGVDGLTATVTFEITKAENGFTITVDNTTCGVAPEVHFDSMAFGGQTSIDSATYKYYIYGTDTEVQFEELDAEEGRYDIVVTVPATENWEEATQTATFAVSHDYSDWATDRSDDVDYALCGCGEIDERITFVKRLTEVQELVVTTVTVASYNESDKTGNTITETYQTGSITLDGIGNGETYTVSDIRLIVADKELVIPNAASKQLPGINVSLGSDIGSLALNKITNKWHHGEQTLTVEVQDDKGKAHLVSVPVLLITRELATKEDLKALFMSSGSSSTLTVTVTNPADGADATYQNVANETFGGNNFWRVYGYYRIADSVGSSGIRYDAYNTGVVFSGTLDGNGKMLDFGHSVQGFSQFGLARKFEHATVKDLTIKIKYYVPNASYRTLFAQDANTVLFDNLTINFTDDTAQSDVGTAGFLFRSSARELTFKHFTLNAPQKTIGSLFGPLYDGNSKASITFEDSVINCVSIEEMAHLNSAVYQPWDFDGLTGTINETVPVGDNKIDLAERDFEIALGVMHTGETNSITLVNGDSRKTITRGVAVEGDKLSGQVSQLGLGKEDNNKTVVFEIDFDYSEYTYGANFEVTASVPAVVLADVHRVTLPTRQDIVLKDASGEKTEAEINLGEYASHTIHSALLQQAGSEALPLEIEGTTIKITDAIKNVVHGEQNLIFSTEAAVEGSELTVDYEITVPVTIVTENITTFNQLKECVSTPNNDSGKYQEGKYFILGADFNMDTYNMSGCTTGVDPTKTGFAGTLDGRNHKLSWGSMYGCGIFGSINGGTVKNIHFYKVSVSGWNRSLLCHSMNNATLENLIVEVSDASDVIGTSGSYTGLFANSRVAGTTTMKNVTVNAENTRLVSLFGKGWENPKQTYKCENVVINVKTLQCLAQNSNTASDKQTLGNDEVPGITVNESEPLEA